MGEIDHGDHHIERGFEGLGAVERGGEDIVHEDAAALVVEDVGDGVAGLLHGDLRGAALELGVEDFGTSGTEARKGELLEAEGVELVPDAGIEVDGGAGAEGFEVALGEAFGVDLEQRLTHEQDGEAFVLGAIQFVERDFVDAVTGEQVGVLFGLAKETDLGDLGFRFDDAVGDAVFDGDLEAIGTGRDEGEFDGGEIGDGEAAVVQAGGADALERLFVRGGVSPLELEN